MMFFAFGLKSSLLLIFFIHGMVFSILLLAKSWQSAHKPSAWLSLFVFLCSLYIAPFMLGYGGWYSTQPYRDFLFYMPLQQLFLLPAVLYFYFRSLLNPSFVFTKKDRLHFLPALLYLLYSTITFVTDKIVLGEPWFYADGKDKDFDGWYQVSGFLWLFFYLVKCLLIYNKYKTVTYNTVSFADMISFKWAKRFLIVFILLLLLRGLFFVINPEWDQFGKKLWYYACFSVLFYYVSICGYANAILAGSPLKNTMFKKLAISEKEIHATTAPQYEPAPTEALQQQDQPVLIHDLEEWKKKMEAVMTEQQLYENPELTITDTCAALNTHPKKISQVINQGFKMNFNDFVNLYRVKAVIEKMEAGEHKTQTLLGIAYDCGFNSKSTFNRAFKRYTSLNPQEYIKKNGLNLVPDQDMGPNE